MKLQAPKGVEILRASHNVGTQSLMTTVIAKLGEHRIRIRRKRDSYDFQSYAVVERWDGAKWRQVDSIHYEEMSGDSYYSRTDKANRPTRGEIKDVSELFDRAAMVLIN